MSQLTWTVVDDFGGKFHVGMYHGDTSGHLMVYCNKKIIIIDFEVQESKKYSFYLGHEFCHLHLDKEKDNFSYSLKKDHLAETPLNEVRKKAWRRDRYKSIVAFISFLILIVITVYMYKTIY